MTFNVEHEFKYELSCINDEQVKNIVIAAFAKVPDYFWTVPASSSGKYHPKSSLGIGGLVRHEKAVFAISEALLTHPTLYSHWDDMTKNVIRAAILLHDTAKQGTKGEPTHTLHEHPLLVKAAYAPEGHNMAMWDLICELIETHMGPWNTKEKSEVVLPVPRHTAQSFVHMCDYLASRKEIEVDTWDRSPQDGYNTGEPIPPASDKQWDYIEGLLPKAQKKGYKPESATLAKIANSELNVKEASELINELKKFIG